MNAPRVVLPGPLTGLAACGSGLPDLVVAQADLAPGLEVCVFGIFDFRDAPKVVLPFPIRRTFSHIFARFRHEAQLPSIATTRGNFRSNADGFRLTQTGLWATREMRARYIVANDYTDQRSGVTQIKNSRPPQIELLTSARGLAAIWVLTHNDSAFRSALGIDNWTQFLAKGYLAVDFFLVLSGFVLTYVHRSEYPSVTASGYARFLWLRLARIYPLYLFLLAVRVGIEAFKWGTGVSGNFLGPAPFEDSNSPSALLANVAMIQAWGMYDEATWVHSFWSVSAEWFAYTWFPLLLLVLGKIAMRKWTLALISILCIGVLLYGVQVFGKLEFPVQWSLLRCMPEFVFGILLALLVPLLQSTWFARWFTPQVACLGVVATLPHVHFGGHDLIFLMASSLFIVSSALHVKSISSSVRWLTHPWLLYLGHISYAIYLVHLIVQSTFRVAAGKVFGEYPPVVEGLFFLIRLVVILIAASLLYRWVEVPARQAMRRLLGEQKPIDQTSLAR